MSAVDPTTTDESVEVNEVENNDEEVLFLRNTTSQSTTSTVGTTFANDTEEYVEKILCLLGMISLKMKMKFLML